MTELSYFDRMYADSPDPWNLAERLYESRKHALTVASLPRVRYARAFEPGCSVGMLTQLLAERCDEVVATDIVAEPLHAAARRAPDAVFAQGRVPADWPDGTFDLIVLSELLYYLSHDERRAVREKALATLRPDGHLVVVHWRHAFEVAACDGDQAHAEITADPAWVVEVQHVERDFRLDVLARAR